MTEHPEQDDFTAPLASPILVTKLYRMPVPPGAVLRSKLLERLEQNRHRALTLVSAPAGYGKSTLVSMWLEATVFPSAWISLDENDNSLLTFFSYVVAGITMVFPDSLPNAGALCRLPNLPPVEVVGNHLLNDLEGIESPFILVLDDFHNVNAQAILDLVTLCLRHPSHNMHLVLITRRDPQLPLPNLRAHRQVTEIRLRDLRFTVPEATDLLSQLLNRPVSAQAAAAWTAKTEGWVTALQLAALTLRHRGESDSLLGEPAIANQYIEEYLLAEVLAQLPQAMQRKLLSVSILDRFCAPLCDTVCPPVEPSDDDEMLTGEAFVDWLRRTNWFLIPLDSEGHWFRLHHLIRQLLRKRLETSIQPDELAGLHRRACAWFSEHDLIDEAIRHAAAAEDWQAAERLIAQHRHKLKNTVQWSRLEAWLQQLPPEIIAQSAYLATVSAYLALFNTGNLEAIVHWTNAARLMVGEHGDSDEARTILGEISAVEITLLVMHGKPDRAEITAHRALDLLPNAPSYPRLLAICANFATMQMQGKYKEGMKSTHAALAKLDWPLGLRADIWSLICNVAYMEGDLDAVLYAGRTCLRLTAQNQMSRSQIVAQQNVGTSHYLRNELEEAEEHLRAVQENDSLASPSVLVTALAGLALVHASRSEWDEAIEIADQTRARFAAEPEVAAKHIADAFRVELALRQGDIADARRRAVGIEFEKRPPLWFFYVPNLTPLKLLLAEGTPHDLERARVALEELDAAMRPIRRKAARIDILALLALVCQAQQDRPAAHTALTEALLLAQKGSFIRTFLDYGPPMLELLQQLLQDHKDLPLAVHTHLMRILNAAQATNPSPDEELLTDRELQVLMWLEADRSPTDIADGLVISISTVRAHIRSIYRKLDVHSRFEAIDRARQLGLL